MRLALTRKYALMPDTERELPPQFVYRARVGEKAIFPKKSPLTVLK